MLSTSDVTTDDFRPSSFVNETRALKEPDVMAEIKVTPGAPVLTPAEGDAACKELKAKSFLKFPRVTRLRCDPPIGHQTYGIFSFIPSKNATPDPEGCFGVIKLRGTFPSEKEADEWGEHIIRNVDSHAEILYCLVGQDYPLAINPNYCERISETDLRKKMSQINVDFVKRKQEEDDATVKEIKERASKLTEEVKEVKVDDIEYYTKIRTKRADLRRNLDIRKRELKDLQKKIGDVNKEIFVLDASHPDFDKESREKYTKEAESVGMAVKDSLLKWWGGEE